MSVKDVLEKANELLRADKRSSAMVDAVTAALESDGVTWAWQLLHLQPWSVCLSNSRPCSPTSLSTGRLIDDAWLLLCGGRDWQSTGSSLGLRTAAIQVLTTDAELAKSQVAPKAPDIFSIPEVKAVRAGGAGHPVAMSGADVVLKRPPPAMKTAGSDKNTRAALSRTERPAPQQQVAVDATRSRIRSAPAASKAMDTLCASTEFQPTDAFNNASWALAFKELSASERNSSDSAFKNESDASARDRPQRREMQESGSGMRGETRERMRTDSKSARDSAMTTRDTRDRERERRREHELPKKQEHVGEGRAGNHGGAWL